MKIELMNQCWKPLRVLPSSPLPTKTEVDQFNLAALQFRTKVEKLAGQSKNFSHVSKWNVKGTYSGQIAEGTENKETTKKKNTAAWTRRLAVNQSVRSD